MLDWNEYQGQLQTAIAEIGRISPKILRGYRGLSEEGFLRR
ncbi:hypothetical protein LEP1GSC050_1671 [Leptospira broomii serovar Hurstbridge str. 5399]|uniref:Uncharacterized protein n=1 Tax=Leptospira broomii serovar Hurstbridge str. 5399 TaxID=1049789 RepID=T0F7Z6_9LEPT|nr:hypothetical protein LEP1GSC050_1671 [Leptospira broomii serovar Hurstbridge str. 5399]